jgi:CheY-like chemotaxis protein
MSIVPCRILLVDHANRRHTWEALAAAAPSAAWTPLDARPFAVWDVDASATVFEIGADGHNLLDLLPALHSLRWCRVRLCHARGQEHVLVILEKKDRTSADTRAMRDETDALAQATHSVAAPSWVGMLQGPGPSFDSTPTPSDPDLAPGLPSGLTTVVLVEDDHMVRSVCRRILQPHFLVAEVAGSLDALALAERLPIPVHVFVTDISLPIMDGVTLSHRWRLLHPESRVLLLSGNPFNPGAPLPGALFLQKPFLAEELVRAVTQQAGRVEMIAHATAR